MSEHTLEDYAHTYRLLCEYLGDTMIFSEITKEHIGEFLVVPKAPL